MEKKIEIIAVDFDGTLCSECYPAIGMPNLPLFALLKGARRQGKKVILWTCRCGDLLEQYGTESRKISADVYIDDKACWPWMTKQEWERYLAG